jgi:hypothetical protein
MTSLNQFLGYEECCYLTMHYQAVVVQSLLPLNYNPMNRPVKLRKVPPAALALHHLNHSSDTLIQASQSTEYSNASRDIAGWGFSRVEANCHAATDSARLWITSLQTDCLVSPIWIQPVKGTMETMIPLEG